MELKKEIVYEILSHGNTDGTATDPSLSNMLRDLGVAIVTPYIEKLVFIGLIKDAVPLFGSRGGMWIGYILNKKGIECSQDQIQFDKYLIEYLEKPIDEVSNSINELVDTCRIKHKNNNFKEDFIQTIEEIAICFKHNCHIATISLCGKVLEITLTNTLRENNIDISNTKTIGQLIRKTRECLPDVYVDPSINNIENIISISRNTAIHFSEKIPVPSRDQTIMVIFATRDVVNRYLSRIS